MLSRRKFVALLAGAAVGGVTAPVWGAITPFPDACRVPRFCYAGPPGWAGKRMLFVTDIHYGNFFGPAEATALNTLVRRQRPALVALGGDLAQTPETDLTEFFARWAPGCPTVFAPGNHDQDANLGGSILAQARAAGVTVLCNAAEDWRGLRLVGLPSALRATQDRALVRAPGFKVVLGHEPDMWDHYRATDLLHLAGHTHGGQIRLLGRPLRLPTLGRKYPLGQYATGGDKFLLVSAGLGCVDVDFRVNCPPEIAVIEFS
jgi:hypothetical protein